MDQRYKILVCLYRNVKYTINGHHRDHVTVYADVVPVALELSTELLKLTPTPGMPAEAGMKINLRITENVERES